MLRCPETRDIEQIIAVHAAARDAGHFLSKGQPQAEDASFRHNLSLAVQLGQNPTQNEPRGAEALVFEVDGAAAGFCLSTVPAPEIAARCFGVASLRELYMAFVYPAFRGRGYGKQLIREWLAGLPSHKLLIARTFPASAHMKGLLVKHRFMVVGQGPSEDTVLLRGDGHVVRKARTNLKMIGGVT